MNVSFLGLLWGLLPLAIGCGAPTRAPVVWEAPITGVSVERIESAGYQHGCIFDDVVWLARGLVVERWRAAQGRVLGTLEATIPFVGPAPAIDAMTCSSSQLTIGAGELALGAAEGRWMFHGSRSAVPEGWPAVGAASLGMWANTLPDGRVIQLGKDLRVLRGLVLLEQRWTPAGIRGATFDGSVIYAVGDAGLWRWKLGRRGVERILLPPTTPLPLLGAFRDGDFMWLRHSDAMVAPYRVLGRTATQARPVGKMPPPPVETTLPVNGATVTVTRDGTLHVEFDRKKVVAGVGRVTALARVSGGVLIGDDQNVHLLTIDGGRSTLKRVLAPGSKTVAIYVTETHAVLVGSDYGLVVAAITRSTAPTRNQHPAP